MVGGMNRGGAETWLMHVLRKIDRKQFHMDFLVHTEKPCNYDDEIRALGSRVIPCLSPKKPWAYALNFRRILKEFGPYDVIHSHVHHYSGFILWLANLMGVPVRIAHSHNDTTLVDRSAGNFRRVYLHLTERMIQKHATVGLACSRQAASALYGTDWESDLRWCILYCGIDLDPFRQSVNRIEVRKELNIPLDSFVVGHVGRFDKQKNHDFLIDIAYELAKEKPNMHLLLIGDGPLRPEIEKKVKSFGLVDKVIFAGVRSDVPRLMKGAMDVFVMPSFHEGLPVVGIEAQASGLPLVISDSITKEMDIVNGAIHRRSIHSSATDWANTILKANNISKNNLESYNMIKNTQFNIKESILALRYFYERVG